MLVAADLQPQAGAEQLLLPEVVARAVGRVEVEVGRPADGAQRDRRRVDPVDLVGVTAGESADLVRLAPAANLPRRGERRVDSRHGHALIPERSAAPPG